MRSVVAQSVCIFGFYQFQVSVIKIYTDILDAGLMISHHGWKSKGNLNLQKVKLTLKLKVWTYIPHLDPFYIPR